MTTARKIHIVNPRDAARLDNIAFALTDNKAAACVWALREKLFYVRFEDFDWNYEGDDALIHRADRDIRLDANCLALDVYNDAHLLFANESSLSYMYQSGGAWSDPSVIYGRSVGTFAATSQQSYPYSPYIAYTRKYDSAEDRLYLTDAQGSFSVDIALEGADNRLLQLKERGIKLFVLWVETDDETNETSSSSSISASSVSSGLTESSLSSLTSSSLQSSSLTSFSGSLSSSSTSEEETYTRVKYLRFDTLSKTFDFFPPYTVDFTSTNGQILSLDFDSIR